MLQGKAEQPVIDYYMYPPVGGDDWRYTFESAEVRAYEMQMLTRAMVLDMVNADSFESAAQTLAGTEYALGSDSQTLAALEAVLAVRRTAIRETFAELMLDKAVVELLKSRSDFANLRLAIRRTATDRPFGADYSDDGNVSPELLERILGEDDCEPAPDYVQDAVDQAVLGYYQNKDVRQIDYVVDRVQNAYNQQRARQLKSVFLQGLFGIKADLANIRTMLRLKFADSQQRNVLLGGGFIELERFERGVEIGYEGLGQLFGATPYGRVVETGASYLASEKSFLKVEQECDAYLAGYLKTTMIVTAGPQPIIAYLLMKEDEIRTIRLILTAKKSGLDTKLIQDRIPQSV